LLLICAIGNERSGAAVLPVDDPLDRLLTQIVASPCAQALSCGRADQQSRAERHHLLFERLAFDQAYQHVDELAGNNDIFSNSLHPYTRALLAAMHVHKEDRSERIILTGDISSPITPPSDRPYHTRRYAKVRKYALVAWFSANVRRSRSFRAVSFWRGRYNRVLLYGTLCQPNLARWVRSGVTLRSCDETN